MTRLVWKWSWTSTAGIPWLGNTDRGKVIASVLQASRRTTKRCKDQLQFQDWSEISIFSGDARDPGLKNRRHEPFVHATQPTKWLYSNPIAITGRRPEKGQLRQRRKRRKEGATVHSQRFGVNDATVHNCLTRHGSYVKWAHVKWSSRHGSPITFQGPRDIFPRFPRHALAMLYTICSCYTK